MIGKGGMGVVWSGSNERTGKRVALKVLRRSFDSDSEAAQLFRREASAAGRVNHPNVVTVFDIIEHERMTCIVMELLDGEPLNEFLLREGPLSMERAAALLLPAMRGVAAANAQGVIHRDLKPHNIFLCMGPDGRLVTTKVLDFGNSLLLETLPGAAPETDRLATIGTPAYMAPEHISGSDPSGQRIDVYGFGVVLFEALAGKHPFPGPPGPELITRILREPPLPLRSFRPDLPREVVGAIERALAKDPNQRFPNLEPFIALLEEHLLSGSSLPRSMTPLAGVPIQPLVEPLSGVADAFVQARRCAEESQRHETRVLYSQRKQSEAPSPGPGIDSKGQPEVSPDEVSAQARSLRRLLNKPIVQGVLFGAVLILVVWLAFPMPEGITGQKPPPPSVPSPSRSAPLVNPERAAAPKPTVETIDPARPVFEEAPRPLEDVRPGPKRPSPENPSSKVARRPPMGRPEQATVSAPPLPAEPAEGSPTPASSDTPSKAATPPPRPSALLEPPPVFQELPSAMGTPPLPSSSPALDEPQEGLRPARQTGTISADSR